MVRRLLSIALLAVLAVALPAAAEEDPAASEPGLDPADCPPLEPCTTSLPDACEAWDLECNLAEAPSLEDATPSSACRAVEYNSPTENGPVWEMVVVDPEGCLMEWVKRSLGIPPIDTVVEVKSALLQTAFNL
jgi:hypothetical protein